MRTLAILLFVVACASREEDALASRRSLCKWNAKDTNKVLDYDKLRDLSSVKDLGEALQFSLKWSPKVDFELRSKNLAKQNELLAKDLWSESELKAMVEASICPVFAPFEYFRALADFDYSQATELEKNTALLVLENYLNPKLSGPDIRVVAFVLRYEVLKTLSANKSLTQPHAGRDFSKLNLEAEALRNDFKKLINARNKNSELKISPEVMAASRAEFVAERELIQKYSLSYETSLQNLLRR